MKEKLFSIVPEEEREAPSIFKGELSWEQLPNGDRKATVKIDEHTLLSGISWEDQRAEGELEVQVDGETKLRLKTNTTTIEKAPLDLVGKEVTFIQKGSGIDVGEIAIFGIKQEIDAKVKDTTDDAAIVELSGMIPGSEYEIKVNEKVVAVFTTKPKGDDPTPPPKGEKVAFHEFMGTNVLPDDPLDVAAPFGHFRGYIYGKWYDKDVDNANVNAPLGQIKYAYNPSDAGGWSQDDFYKTYGKAGMLFPTCFESYMRLTNNDKTWLNAVPYKRGERGELENPMAWRHIAAYYFQMAARYGSTKVDLKYIRVQDNNQPLTGLGAIQYIEGENEPDRWWIGHDKADLSGREIAAYMSAIYDGHMGTMIDPNGDQNVKFGAKTADPTIKVVMPGIAYLDYNLLEDMVSWFEQNRTDPNYETYPFEVFNFHDYANTERKQRNLSGKGLSPESYGWREVHEKFIEWVEGRIPYKEFEKWNTEFGYDTEQGSPQRCEPYGEFNAEQVQGIWLVRAFLEMCAAGIDRATQFYLRDNEPGKNGIFQSCGVTVKSENYRKKVSWYHLHTLKNVLTGFRYVRDVRRDAQAYVYEFHNQETNEYCYAAWCPTQESKIASISFDVNSSSDLGDVYEILDNNINGQKMPIGITNGKVQLVVDEKVKFIKVK